MNSLKKEIDLLMHITTKYLNLDIEDINVQQKTDTQVMARMIICNILMENGIKPAQLANHFCKHRTNFYHYLKLHKSYIVNPRMYPLYIDNFNAIYAEYKKKSNHISEIQNLQAIEDIVNALLELVQIRKFLQNGKTKFEKASN